MGRRTRQGIGNIRHLQHILKLISMLFTQDWLTHITRVMYKSTPIRTRKQLVSYYYYIVGKIWMLCTWELRDVPMRFYGTIYSFGGLLTFIVEYCVLKYHITKLNSQRQHYIIGSTTIYGRWLSLIYLLKYRYSYFQNRIK